MSKTQQNKLNSVSINDINIDNVYLHYTNLDNLDNIAQKGLEPRIGMNSKVIEKNKKIFFSIGDRGALVIMDVWIKWLIAKPKTNLVYWTGTYLLQVRFFPKIIHDIIINCNKKNKNKHKWAYKKLKKILDNSVYLVLKLEEDVDFSFDDIDEVKALSKYPVKYIEDMYANDSDPFNTKMEYWNMHTFADRIIEQDKLSILKHNDSFKASYILKYLIEKNIDYVEESCENLYKYYKYIEK